MYVTCQLGHQIFVNFYNGSNELLEIMSDNRAFHSLVVTGKNYFRIYVEQVSNLKTKLA